MSLSDDGTAIESTDTLAMTLPQFDEPTLGTVVGDDFYFVANSHWNCFDEENNLPEGMSGLIVKQAVIGKICRNLAGIQIQISSQRNLNGG